MDEENTPYCLRFLYVVQGHRSRDGQRCNRGDPIQKNQMRHRSKTVPAYIISASSILCTRTMRTQTALQLQLTHHTLTTCRTVHSRYQRRITIGMETEDSLKL
jgi:hypothetical protein